MNKYSSNHKQHCVLKTIPKYIIYNQRPKTQIKREKKIWINKDLKNKVIMKDNYGLSVFWFWFCIH